MPLAALSLALFASSLLPAFGVADEPETLAIGSPAPDFNLPGVDGRTYRLADFAGSEVLVIVFTCNHCPTAQAYEGRIKKLAEDYRGRGVSLVAISPNDPQAVRLDELGYSDLSDSFEEMKIRARDAAFNFPYLYDGDTQQAARAYGPTSTPHLFVFDAKRKLRFAGRVDDEEKIERATVHDTRNAIEAILANKAVPVETTKTFGCSIKWADKRASVKRGFEEWAREEVRLDTLDEAGVRRLVKNDSKKLLLVNVWATWCGPCVIEFPTLITANRMYRGRPFELITISADSPGKRADALAFLRKQQASGRNYIFALDNIYKLVEAVDPAWRGALPYTMLVAPGGKVIYRKMGEVDALQLKKAIVGHLGRIYE